MSCSSYTLSHLSPLLPLLPLSSLFPRGIAITDNEPRTVGESWQKTKDAASATGKYVSGAATKAAGAIKEAIAGSTPGDSVDTTSRQETAGSSGVSKLHQAAPNENNPNAGRTAPGSGTSVDTVEAKSEAPPSQRPKLATYEGVPQQPIGNAKHVSTGAVTDANPNPHDGTRAA